MRRRLTIAAIGLVLAIALAAGATVAVRAATGGSSSSATGSPAAPTQEEGRAWLGILAGPFGQEGVIVQQVVADSPAHQAGLKRGDVITAADGKKVVTIGDLLDILEEKHPGDELALAIRRDDDEKEIAVTLAERPAPLRPSESKGPFPELGELELSDILHGELSIRSDDGKVVTIEAVLGKVKALAEDELTLALNDGGERTYKITNATLMPVRDLEEGTPVLVAALKESDEARLVLPAKPLDLLPLFKDLRERLPPLEKLPFEFGPCREFPFPFFWHSPVEPEPQFIPLPDCKLKPAPFQVEEDAEAY